MFSVPATPNYLLAQAVYDLAVGHAFGTFLFLTQVVTCGSIYYMTNCLAVLFYIDWSRPLGLSYVRFVIIPANLWIISCFCVLRNLTVWTSIWHTYFGEHTFSVDHVRSALHQLQFPRLDSFSPAGSWGDFRFSVIGNMALTLAICFQWHSFCSFPGHRKYLQVDLYCCPRKLRQTRTST